MKEKEFTALQESSDPVVAKAREALSEEMVSLKKAISAAIYESHRKVTELLEPVNKSQSVGDPEKNSFAGSCAFNLVMHAVEATVATVWSLTPNGINLGAMIADANAEALKLIHEMAVEAEGYPAKSCPCFECHRAKIRREDKPQYDA